MQQKLNIEDGANDKKYFTIIPNYVIDTLDGWDFKLYAQMKRIAGEKETCYMSLSNLKKKCQMSRDRALKSIKSLTDKKLIIKLGEKQIPTGGGYQYTSIYRMKDIWKMNIEHYDKGCPPDGLPEVKGCPPDGQGGVRPAGTTKNQEYNNNQSKSFTADKSAGAEVNDLIDKFKNVNPTHERFFKQTGQRKAIERLLKKETKEKLGEVIDMLVITNKMRYAPSITTPAQLENKIGSWLVFYQREKAKVEGSKPFIV
jgi:CTP-dependent riboflavin kinase